MDKKLEKNQKAYADYVKTVTPTHNLGLQMLKAFWVGGVICVLGEVIINVGINSFDLDQKTAG